MKDYLEIKNVRLENSGNYTCKIKAWQSAASDEITHELEVQAVPSKPDLKLASTQSETAKFNLRASSVLPVLWCSVFYRAKFGRHEEKVLPGRQLYEVKLDNLKCGQVYK